MIGYGQNELVNQNGAQMTINVTNPTLRENIEGKIKYYKDEIIRLEKIKEKIPENMMDINLRDLREAMNY